MPSTPIDLLAPENSWPRRGLGAVRGVTIGPIENALHPGKGYGSVASARAMDEAVATGATWVSLTPFGRVWSLSSQGVDLTFEAPFPENRAAVLGAIRQAHERGRVSKTSPNPPPPRSRPNPGRRLDGPPGRLPGSSPTSFAPSPATVRARISPGARTFARRRAHVAGGPVPSRSAPLLRVARGLAAHHDRLPVRRPAAR